MIIINNNSINITFVRKISMMFLKIIIIHYNLRFIKYSLPRAHKMKIFLINYKERNFPLEKKRKKKKI